MAVCKRSRRLVSCRPDRYTINFDRAVKVIGTLVRGYANSVHPFGQAHWLLPEQSIALPEHLNNNPQACARFFFWSCMFMRGRITSVQAIQRLLRLTLTEAAEGWDDLLDPQVAVSLPVEYIDYVLSQYGLSRYGAGWIANAQRLLDRYNGDVLRLFDGVTTFEEACRRICNKNGRGYWGFQKKMTSMILYYLVEAGLIKPFPFPPPVDWHHVSLAWRTGIIDLHGNVLSSKEDLEEGCLEDLREIYMQYSGATGTSTVTIAKACWLFSRYLCSPAPGNSLAERGEYEARSTRHIYKAPDFETAPISVIEAWQRTCGLCPVRSECGLLMSSAQWFDKGLLGELMTARTEPSPARLAEAGLFNPYELVNPPREQIACPVSISNGRPATVPTAPNDEQLPLF